MYEYVISADVASDTWGGFKRIAATNKGTTCSSVEHDCSIWYARIIDVIPLNVLIILLNTNLCFKKYIKLHERFYLPYLWESNTIFFVCVFNILTFEWFSDLSTSQHWVFSPWTALMRSGVLDEMVCTLWDLVYVMRSGVLYEIMCTLWDLMYVMRSRILDEISFLDEISCTWWNLVNCMSTTLPLGCVVLLSNIPTTTTTTTTTLDVRLIASRSHSHHSACVSITSIISTTTSSRSGHSQHCQSFITLSTWHLTCSKPFLLLLFKT